MTLTGWGLGWNLSEFRSLFNQSINFDFRFFYSVEGEEDLRRPIVQGPFSPFCTHFSELELARVKPGIVKSRFFEEKNGENINKTIVDLKVCKICKNCTGKNLVIHFSHSKKSDIYPISIYHANPRLKPIKTAFIPSRPDSWHR